MQPDLPFAWRGEWPSLSLIAVTFAALTAWSWRKWPDVLVDFGQQLYIPWRLASGEHLYKDIVLLFGPLSQHVNALLFRTFGVSLTVLFAANLVVLAAITSIMYAVFRRSTDRLTATLVCLLFLCIFGFSQYTGIGNFNYVTPYTHEATHGVLLTTGMVLLLSLYISTESRAACVAAGVCWGLALLTRIDVALAATAVAAAGLAAACLARDGRRRRVVVDTAAFVAVAMLPLAAFFAYFLSYLPAHAAFEGARHGFALVSSDVASNAFFQHVTGLDDVVGNVTKMITMFGWILAAVSCAAVVDVVVGRMTRRPQVAGIILGIGLLAALVANLDAVPWGSLAQALPLTAATALVAFAWLFARVRRDAAGRSIVAPMWLWSVLALTFLSKMLLNTRISNYGFYLAMPATVLLAANLIWWVPRALRATAGRGVVFRSLAVAVLTAAVVSHLHTSEHTFYRVKTLPVGQGGDTMLTFGSTQVATIGSTVADALRWMNVHVPPEATFAAFPEGITLNYLARRPTTLPVMNFMMTEELVFGEQIVLDSLKQRPPDYVLLVHKDTSEFGFPAFGADPRYGQRILEYIESCYEPVALFGAEPFTGRAFGIKILKRQ